MNIRRATLNDIDSMIELARTSDSAAQWTRQQYQDVFLGTGVPRLAIIAEPHAPLSPQDASVLGFLVARHLPPEWELESIVVAPAARRKAIGKQLVDALLTAARGTGSNSVSLEVRQSNLAAQALYQRCDFEAHGCRKSYYSNPVEDAILYRRTLP
jgi:[ribosomal protein S18]-alanine N-acetyltransferase